jgi:hypothetical protein
VSRPLRGTYEATRDAPANPDRIRLTEAIEPPDDLDKDAKAECDCISNCVYWLARWAVTAVSRDSLKRTPPTSVLGARLRFG